jgi:hypothetical protein
MMSLLNEQSVEGLDLDNVLVEVYKELAEYGEDHAKDIFLEINKAEPVKLLDMPGVATAKDRTIINRGAQLLMERYPSMFSPSQKCRVPNLNIDNLRDALFAANVIKRHSLTTASALEAWLLEQNAIMEAKYQSDEAKKTVSVSALAKAETHSFYLGLDSSWYYH